MPSKLSSSFVSSIKAYAINLYGGWFSLICSKFKNDSQRLLKVGFFHVLVITVCVRGAGFIQQIALARLLSPDDLGKTMFIFRLLTMVCVAADLGMSTSLLKFSAEPVDDKQKNVIYRTALVSVLCLSSLTAVIFSVTVILTKGFGTQEELLLPLVFGALYIPLVCLNRLPALFLQAQKKIKQASMVSGATHLFLLASMITATYFYQFWGYLFTLVLGQLVSLAIFLVYTHSAFTRVKPDLSIFFKLTKFGFFSMLANFSGVINATLGVLLLKSLNYGFQEIALYGVASVVVNGLRLIPQSLLRTVFPYLVSSINNKQALKKKVRETVIKQGSMVMTIAIITSAAGYWMLPLIFGEIYQESWPTMVILFVSLIFWAIGAPYGQLQMALNLVRLNFAISLLQLSINFILSLILIPDLGAQGAALALCISYGFHLVLLSMSGEKALKVNIKSGV